MIQNFDQGSENQSEFLAEHGECDQVQLLTWAMLDDELSSDQFSLLNSLLLHSEEARDSYLSTIHLHAFLMTRFAQQSSVPIEAGVNQCADLVC